MKCNWLFLIKFNLNSNSVENQKLDKSLPLPLTKSFSNLNCSVLYPIVLMCSKLSDFNIPMIFYTFRPYHYND